MPQRRALTACIVALGLLPLTALVLRASFGDAIGHGLGANPVEEITHETGITALRLLVATLCVTPLRRLSGWTWLAPERRTLGLLAFGYATLHVATYALLDVGLDLEAIREDLAQRTYVVLGFATWLLLVPLAATSTRLAARRLGRRWLALHRLSYVCAIGGVSHYLWLVKKDVRPPLAYAAAVALLLGWRLVRHLRVRRAATPTRSAIRPVTS